MSSKQGTRFGEEFGSEYGEVVEKWGKRLKGVEKISDSMKKEWSADMEKSLGEQVLKSLKSQANVWKSVSPLPSDETLERFAKIAVKGSLAEDSMDLLERLRKMAQEPEPEDAITAAITVGEALKRVGQTVSQVFDMAKDRFNRLMSNHFRDEGKLTGRRRWRTTSLKSRHRQLNHQVKSEGDNFIFKGSSVYGPRPPGGSPENWSNCSCYLQLEKDNGDWVRMGR